MEFDTYIPPPISEVLSSTRIVSKVGEQLETTTHPPTGSDPPLNEIPLTVIFSLSGPSKEKQFPPRGPGPKNVSEIETIDDFNLEDILKKDSSETSKENISKSNSIEKSVLDKIKTDSIKSPWLTTASQELKFEKKLSNYLRYKHVVALNSCTAGLHLALAAKEFSKGDKFLAPVLTFVSTIECGEYLGMSPVLVDCKKNGFYEYKRYLFSI